MQNKALTKAQANDWAALAFIGDAVYEIYVRKHVLSQAYCEDGAEHSAKVDALHHHTVDFVKAEGQAHAMKAMMDELPEEYREIVRKARNHKPHSVPKHADVMDYKWATAFEALLGYLYLEEKTEELERIAARAIEITEND